MGQSNSITSWQGEDTAYEARAIGAVGRGLADIDAGRFTESINDAFDRAAKLRELGGGSNYDKVSRY